MVKRITAKQREAMRRNLAKSSCWQKGQDHNELSEVEKQARKKVLRKVRIALDMPRHATPP